MKTTTTISIDKDVKEKASENFENLSGKIEELLRQELETGEGRHPDIDLLKRSHLNRKRRSIVREMAKSGAGEMTFQEFISFVKNHGIYEQKNGIENAFKQIGKDSNSLYEEENGVLVAVEYEHRCGSKFTAPVLGNNGGFCPGCGAMLLQLESETQISKA